MDWSIACLVVFAYLWIRVVWSLLMAFFLSRRGDATHGKVPIPNSSLQGIPKRPERSLPAEDGAPLGGYSHPSPAATSRSSHPGNLRRLWDRSNQVQTVSGSVVEGVEGFQGEGKGSFTCGSRGGDCGWSWKRPIGDAVYRCCSRAGHVLSGLRFEFCFYHWTRKLVWLSEWFIFYHLNRRLIDWLIAYRFGLLVFIWFLFGFYLVLIVVRLLVFFDWLNLWLIGCIFRHLFCIAVQVYALDKNPIAISAMTAKLDNGWKQHASNIHIVQSDMRAFQPKFLVRSQMFLIPPGVMLVFLFIQLNVNRPLYLQRNSKFESNNVY